MRFVIYGAGAIGNVVGARLALAGKDVILIGRPGHVKAVREHGLKFFIGDVARMVNIPAVSSPGEIKFASDDVILLTVKSQDTDGALADLKKVVADLPIFCIQNGVRNEEMATRHFSRIYGSRVSLPGTFLKDGEVMTESGVPGLLIMGRYPTGVDNTVEAVAAGLRAAGFTVMVTPDVMPYKWGKLMRNLGNAIGAITDAVGEDNSRISKAVRQEAEDILAQAGIKWIWVSAEEAALEKANQPPKNSSVDFLVQMQPKREQNSTWQSLARQTGQAEVEFLNGEIMRLAKQLGKQAPVNEMLTRIVKAMAAKRELPGKYTPSQLLKLVGVG